MKPLDAKLHGSSHACKYILTCKHIDTEFDGNFDIAALHYPKNFSYVNDHNNKNECDVL